MIIKQILILKLLEEESFDFRIGMNDFHLATTYYIYYMTLFLSYLELEVGTWIQILFFFPFSQFLKSSHMS